MLLGREHAPTRPPARRGITLQTRACLACDNCRNPINRHHRWLAAKLSAVRDAPGSIAPALEAPTGAMTGWLLSLCAA